jgi:hypothetical protein
MSAKANTTPGVVKGLSGATTLASGTYSSCAIASGKVFCWGYNQTGGTGNGTLVDATSATQIPGITTATSVVVGDQGACALLLGGTVDCRARTATARSVWGRGETRRSHS